MGGSNVSRFDWVAALPTNTRLKIREWCFRVWEQKVEFEKSGKSGVQRNLNSVEKRNPGRCKYWE